RQLGAVPFSPVRTLLDANADISVRPTRPNYEPIREYDARHFGTLLPWFSPRRAPLVVSAISRDPPLAINAIDHRGHACQIIWMCREAVRADGHQDHGGQYHAECPAKKH